MGRSLGERTDRPLPGPEHAAKAPRRPGVVRAATAPVGPSAARQPTAGHPDLDDGHRRAGQLRRQGAARRRAPAAGQRARTRRSQISGQVGTARADADARVIRSSVASALGGVGFGMLSGRWSDQLTLPKSRGADPGAADPGRRPRRCRRPRAADLRALAGPPPGQGSRSTVALPASTAAMLHFAVGQVLTLPRQPHRCAGPGSGSPGCTGRGTRRRRTGGSACSAPRASWCRARSSPTGPCWWPRPPSGPAG